VEFDIFDSIRSAQHTQCSAGTVPFSAINGVCAAQLFESEVVSPAATPAGTAIAFNRKVSDEC